MEEAKFNAKEYVPGWIFEPMDSISLIIASRRHRSMQEAYKATDDAYWKWVRKVRTNNWLKMHGKPMKRKIH